MNKEVAKQLKIVLANTFTLYLKSQFFHWNVTGQDFPQLHLLFESQYGELYEAVDQIAEKVRYLGFFAPGSYERFGELSSIKSALDVPSAHEMLVELKQDHETLIGVLNVAFKAAQAADDQSTMNFLAERLDRSKKHHWMLTATSMNPPRLQN